MMIGIWSSYSKIVLYFNSTALILAFCIPLMIAPIKWAKVFRWPIPEHDHLAVYFGRCLGGVCCILALFGFTVMHDSSLLPLFYNLGLVVDIVMIVIHAYGGIKKIQPITETIEIIFWISQVVLGLCFYPGPQITL
jgi:hypothetical protein